MKIKKCLRCNKKITGHFNRKRCKPCVNILVKRPESSLTKAQIRKAESMIGKMDRKDIAKKLGTSLSNLKRAFRGKTLNYHNYCVANPNLIHDVNKYFQNHSIGETAKHFKLKKKQIEYIVYRYKMYRPKQIKWKNNEIIEAAKMAGLVSPKAQAKYFNRPNANAGSIKSLWVKRFNLSSGCINGMARNNAKHLVNQNAKYLKPMGQIRQGKLLAFRNIILWVDMEKCLKNEVPTYIKDAVKTMASFQRWLHGGGDVRSKIIKMMEREKND